MNTHLPSSFRWPSRSGTLLFALVCASLGAAGTGWLASGRLSSQNGLVANLEKIDFGDLKQGDVKTAVFVLTNRSAEPLVLRDVSTGCSCRSAVLGRKVLKPSETTTLTVTWRVGARRGVVNDQIWLEYSPQSLSDAIPAAMHRITLAICALIVPEIKYYPEQIEFERGIPSTIIVRLAPGHKQEFVVKQAVCTSRAFVVVYDAGHMELTVTYTPANSLDYGDGIQVRVETDCPIEPTLSIPVSVRVKN